MRLSELVGKEIIDGTNATSLGTITRPEVEIDTDSGYIVSMIVPGGRRGFLSLGREPDLAIPWSSIKMIGPELVIVEMSMELTEHDDK